MNAWAGIAAAVTRAGGVLLITADHGNIEMMRDPVTGEPHTAHTLNPVPIMLVNGPPGVDRARQWPARRCRADLAGADGLEAAGGDDRPLAASRRGCACHG